jgi:hypothetical protein
MERHRNEVSRLDPQSTLPEDRIAEIPQTIRNFEHVKSVSQLTSLLSN